MLPQNVSVASCIAQSETIAPAAVATNVPRALLDTTVARDLSTAKKRNAQLAPTKMKQAKLLVNHAHLVPTAQQQRLFRVSLATIAPMEYINTAVQQELISLPQARHAVTAATLTTTVLA